MKQFLKRISVLLVALGMAVGFAAPALASSTGTGTAAAATATSTATVTAATGNADDTLSAYKVIAAALDTDKNTLTYTFTDLFKAFLASTAGKTNDYSSLTVDQYTDMIKTDAADTTSGTGSAAFRTLLGDFTAYIRSQTTQPAADYTATTDASGSATFTNVAMGQYIILGSGNSTGAYVYQTVTAEVIPYVDGNTYKLYPTYAVVMKTTKPTGGKTVTGTVTDKNNTQSASIGDTLTYTLTATVPTYSESATNKTFYMGDTLSNGLTLSSTADTIAVKGYTSDTDKTGTTLTAGTNYTVKIDGQKLYIDFSYDTIKQYASVSAVYTAVLNENAKVGSAAGNLNTYDLVYSNDPFHGSTSTDHPVPGTPGYGSDEKTVTVYTYALIINKYKTGSETTKLANAVFAVKDGDGKVIATITTDENGYAAYSGLKAGTYTLTETKAPAGYKLLSSDLTITIDSSATAFSAATTTTKVTYTTDAAKSKFGVQATDSNGKKLWLTAGATGSTPTASDTQPDGMVAAYVATVETTVTKDSVKSGSAADGYYTENVANTPGSSLPTTGGIGTMLFTIIGSCLMAGAAVLLITKKRMSAK